MGDSFVDRLEQHRGLWDQVKATVDFPSDARDAFSEFSRYVIYFAADGFPAWKAKRKGRFSTCGPAWRGASGSRVELFEVLGPPQEERKAAQGIRRD